MRFLICIQTGFKLIGSKGVAYYLTQTNIYDDYCILCKDEQALMNKYESYTR